MTSVAWDTSNLAVYFKDGAVCTSCCNAGDPCTHCDVTTPKTIFVQITGATDVFNGICGCIDFGGGIGSRSAKFEGMAADDVLNNNIVTCIQDDINPCIFRALVSLDAATLKRYSPACTPVDCTGAVVDTRKMCWLQYEITRLATQTQVHIFLLGEEDPGDYDPENPIISCAIAWLSIVNVFIPCDGPDCLCCEMEPAGGSVFWDITNATVRTWSVLCPTMHVNNVVASANAAGCGGDEEKVQVDVTVHDSDDVVLENAHVEITLTGEVENVVYADTDAFGVATYLSDCLCINGTINVEVTNVTKGGYLWDSDDDEDSLTDSVDMDCV